MASASLPSSSLVRAAATESARIDRAVAGLRGRQSDLEAQLAGVRQEIDGLVERQSLLAQLVDADRPSDVPEPSGRLLRGRELRREAARVLWQSMGESQLHYRELYERLLASEIRVGGKDPVASFLTNLRDSPAVIKGSQPGYYRLDPASQQRASAALEEAVAELADVTATLERARRAGGTMHVDELRGHRDRMTHRVRALESDLAEVRAVFAWTEENRNAA